MSRYSMPNFLLASCSAIGLAALPASVSAQEAASATAAATPQDDNGFETSEIVVTAQRRAENVQDVPIMVQAIGGAALAQSGVKGVNDLMAVVSGVQMGRSSGGSTPYIRGIGTAAGAAGTEPAIATYVDGVYHQSAYANHISFVDIERVEVLKGPQGTLFGRNSTGGLINIITRTPKQEAEGEFHVSIGNYKTYEATAYLSGGVGENLAASVSGHFRDQSKGYGKNALTGRREFEHDEKSGRMKVRYDDGDTKVTFTGDYSNQDDPRGFRRGVPKGSIGGVPNNPALQTTYIAFRTIENSGQAKQKIEDYGASLTAEQSFDSFDFTSVSGYRDNGINIRIADNDYTRAPLASATIFYSDRNFTQEFRVASNSASRFNWLAGTFYLNGRSINKLVTPVVLNGYLRTKSYSAFAEVGIKFFDDAGKLTLGGRYTIDKRAVRGTVNGNKVPGPAVDPTTTYKEPTYRIVYSHDITDNVMLFAGFNRGFKSGNYNLAPVGSQPFNPEIIDAYEGGFKATLLDRRLRFNGSIFHYKYSDLQLNVTTLTTTFTTNAAGAKFDGVELELHADVADGLTIDLGGTYLDAKYSNFPNAQVYLPNRNPTTGALIGGTTARAVNVTGNPVPRSPKYSAIAGFSYSHDVNGGKINATVRSNYSSSYSFEPGNRLRQKGYVNFNAGIGYQSEAGWGVRFEGTNITDAKYSLQSNSTTAGDAYIPNDPALYSLILSYKF